jgi:hypothetical protein
MAEEIPGFGGAAISTGAAALSNPPFGLPSASAVARARLLYEDLRKHVVDLRRALETAELSKNAALFELNEKLLSLEKPIDPVNPPSATLHAADFVIDLAKSFAKGVATEGGKYAANGIAHLLSAHIMGESR